MLWKFGSHLKLSKKKKKDLENLDKNWKFRKKWEIWKKNFGNLEKKIGNKFEIGNFFQIWGKFQNLEKNWKLENGRKWKFGKTSSSTVEIGHNPWPWLLVNIERDFKNF